MHTVMVRAVTAAILLSVLACEGRSLFLEIENGDASFELQTIKTGAIVASEIDVTFRYRDNPETTPEALALDWTVRPVDSGEALLARSLELDARNPQAKLELPDSLEIGVYMLELTLRQDERVLEQHEREFFRTAESYAIARVSSYPAAFAPESDGILVARVKHPAAQPPFVRVRFAGQDRSAVVEDGRFEVVLHSPETEGVYLARFELFPVPPPAGRPEYEYDGPIVYNHKLIVKDRPAARFAEDERSFARFALRGNLRDSGLRPIIAPESSEAATPIGYPRLAVREEVFGYWLESGEGFELSDFLLPVRDRAVQPFILEFDIYLPTEQRNRHVFRTHADAEQPVAVAVMIGEEGRLLLLLSSGERHASVETEERVFPVGSSSRIRVAVRPGADGTVVRVASRRGVRFEKLIEELTEDAWRLGSFERREVSEEAAEHSHSVAAGRTVVGGENGFYGIIESFSAYLGGSFADLDGSDGVY